MFTIWGDVCVIGTVTIIGWVLLLLYEDLFKIAINNDES